MVFIHSYEFRQCTSLDRCSQKHRELRTAYIVKMNAVWPSGRFWWQQEMFLLLLPHLWEHMGKKCFLSEIMKASVCLTRNSTLTTENILTAWENFNRTIGRVLLTCSLQTLHSSKESGSELSPRPLLCLFLLTTL